MGTFPAEPPADLTSGQLVGSYRTASLAERSDGRENGKCQRQGGPGRETPSALPLSLFRPGLCPLDPEPGVPLERD